MIDSDRPVDVLQRLLTHILKGNVEFVADVIADRARNSDAPWPGDRLDARRL